MPDKDGYKNIYCVMYRPYNCDKNILNGNYGATNVLLKTRLYLPVILSADPQRRADEESLNEWYKNWNKLCVFEIGDPLSAHQESNAQGDGART